MEQIDDFIIKKKNKKRKWLLWIILSASLVIILGAIFLFGGKDMAYNLIGLKGNSLNGFNSESTALILNSTKLYANKHIYDSAGGVGEITEDKDSILKWDISSIPIGATIDNAFLYMTQTDFDTSAGTDTKVYFINNQTWNESSDITQFPDFRINETSESIFLNNSYEQGYYAGSGITNCWQNPPCLWRWNVTTQVRQAMALGVKNMTLYVGGNYKNDSGSFFYGGQEVSLKLATGESNKFAFDSRTDTNPPSLNITYRVVCNVTAGTNLSCQCASVFTSSDTSWQFYDSKCTDNGGSYTMATLPDADCDTFSVTGTTGDCAWNVNQGDLCPSYARAGHAVTIADCSCQVPSSCSSRGNCGDLNQSDCQLVYGDYCEWGGDPEICFGIGGYPQPSTAFVNLSDTFFAGEGGDTTPPYFTFIPANATLNYGASLGVDFNATDAVGFGTYVVNDTTNFQINASGWLSNKTGLNAGTYNLNITINDTSNNLNSTTWRLVVRNPTSISMALITPTTSQVNVTKGEFFNVSVNISCPNSDCGDINLSLDPSTNLVLNYSYDLADVYVEEYNVYPEWYKDIFMKWDISSVPAGSTVNNATLCLYGTDDSGYFDYTDNIYYINNETWSETTAGGQLKAMSRTNINATVYSYSDIGLVWMCGEVTNALRNATANGNKNMTIRIGTNLDDAPDNNPATQNQQALYLANTEGTGGDDWGEDRENTKGTNNRPYLNITYNPASTAKGLIPNGTGTPFYTTSGNPQTVNLNNSQSVVVTWLVNATGTAGNNYTFFVYANKTSNLAINNITGTWNVTIREEEICQNNITNTTQTDWINTTCSGDNMNQTANFTEYDVNTCGNFTNVTHYVSQLVGPTFLNTSFGDWTNLSCVNFTTINQSRFLTEYDTYSCASNITFYEYQNASSTLCEPLAACTTNAYNKIKLYAPPYVAICKGNTFL